MDVQPHGEPAARDHRLGCRPAAAGRLHVGDLHGPEDNRGIRQRHTRPEPELHAVLFARRHRRPAGGCPALGPPPSIATERRGRSEVARRTRLDPRRVYRQSIRDLTAVWSTLPSRACARSEALRPVEPARGAGADANQCAADSTCRVRENTSTPSTWSSPSSIESACGRRRGFAGAWSDRRFSERAALVGLADRGVGEEARGVTHRDPRRDPIRHGDPRDGRHSHGRGPAGRCRWGTSSLTGTDRRHTLTPGGTCARRGESWRGRCGGATIAGR